MSNAEGAGDLHGAHPMQSTANRAAALGTIWTAAKDAGFDAGLQIGGVVSRHFREKTIIRIFRRIQKCLRNAFIHQQLRKLLGKKG
jgi:hypothetical protein